MSDPPHDVPENRVGAIPTSPPAGRGIAVIHLVREPNGIRTFQSFLDSYRRHAAGMPHELVILFKGFPEGRVPTEYHQALGEIEYSPLFVPDLGHDIASYFRGARACDHEYLLFLNSFSEILDDGWLAKLYAHAASEGVGVVGATGSLESPANSVHTLRRAAIWSERQSRLAGLLDPLRIARRLRFWRRVRTLRRQFPPFPNPHLRTNAFLIRRERFLALRVGPVETKRESVMFECGWSGMTRQLLEMNLDAIVVGRDGQGYTQESWYAGRTFRSGEQRNLLIADNRTKDFERSDPEVKSRETFVAWGIATDGSNGRS